MGATYKAAENTSVLSLKTQTVASNSDAFLDFREHKCNFMLGPRTQQVESPQQSVSSHFEQRMEQMAETIMTKAMEKNAELANRLQGSVQQTESTGGSSGQASSNPLSGVKALEGAELYAVMGFCGVTDPSHVPKIWRTIYNANASLLTKRQEVETQLKEWSVESGYSINKLIRLSKDWFTDTKGADFAMGEARASWQMLDRGFLAQTALQVSMEYIAKMNEKERAEQDTEHTRTLAERLQLSKSDPRPPPLTLEELRSGVATYARLVFIHFGPQCDLYRKLVAMRNTLESSGVEQVKRAYTPDKVMQYWFEVLDKSRLYFHEGMLQKSDFDHPNGPSYPICALSSLLPEIIAGRSIENCAFPQKWRNATAMPLGNISGRAGMQGIGAGARSVSFGGAMSGAGGMTTTIGTVGASTRQARPSTPPSSAMWAPPDTMPPPSFAAGDKLAHCHPIVRKEFAEFHKMYGGPPRLQALCKHSDVKISDLLMQNSFRGNDGTNTMCFNYVLGVCTNPNCRRVHPRHTDLIENYVRALCTQLKKGREYMLAHPDSGAKRSSGAG